MNERELSKAQRAYDRQEEPESCEDGHVGPWVFVGSYRDSYGCDVEFVKCLNCGEVMN